MSDEWVLRYHNDFSQMGVVELHFKPVAVDSMMVGEPFPCDVYNRLGLKLLQAGTVIHSLPELEQLLARGLYTATPVKQAGQIKPVGASLTAEQRAFLMMDDIKVQLKNLFAHLKHPKARDFFIRQLCGVAHHLQQVCLLDGDAALACLHLDYDTPYIVQHSLHAALIMAMVSQLLDIADDKRQVMIAAALTHDIGLLDIQDTLDQQEAPLNATQKQRIHDHPLDGASLLEKLGVDDVMWLNTVKHHHERIDGSGYPAQLAKSLIKIPARLLSIGDCYSAMVRPRPYRKALLSQKVMQNLLLEQTGKVDQRLVELLIKACGMFPAGVIVKLASDEIAVVKKQQKHANMPLVSVFVKADGSLRAEPVLRDTSEPSYAITGILNVNLFQADVSRLRTLWTKAAA